MEGLPIKKLHMGTRTHDPTLIRRSVSRNTLKMTKEMPDATEPQPT